MSTSIYPHTGTEGAEKLNKQTVLTDIDIFHLVNKRCFKLESDISKINFLQI